MIIEEIKNIKSGKKELRQFGITFSIVLGLLGGLFFFRGKDYYSYFFVFSGAFLFLGLLVPTLLKPIQKAWMSLAVFVGWLVTRVILTVLFYLVVTPIGILARIFGKRFLDTRFNRNVDSYWIARKPAAVERKSYENQF